MYIFVVRGSHILLTSERATRDRLCRDSYRHFESSINDWKNRINRISFQENRARSKGNIFANENLCNGRPGETGEKGLLKIDAARNGGINGGSSVSITRGIIYQETSNNYCCLAHILRPATSSGRPLAFIALVEGSQFFSPVPSEHVSSLSPIFRQSISTIIIFLFE